MSKSNMITNRAFEHEFRKLQTLPKERAFQLNIPKSFCQALGMRKHDLIKFSIDKEGNRIIVQKAFSEEGKEVR